MALSIVGTGGGERKNQDDGGRPAAHGRTNVGTTENKNVRKKDTFIT